MIRRKNRYMVRLSDDERKMYDALRIRLRCEEWSEFVRECLRRCFEQETAQSPIALTPEQEDKSFPLVDLKKKPRNAKKKKPASKRAKVAIAG